MLEAQVEESLTGLPEKGGEALVVELPQFLCTTLGH